MANEQSVTIRYDVQNGQFMDRINPGVLTYDQSSAGGGPPGVVSATTSWATVSFGSVTPGYIYVRNLSTGATVQFRTTSGGVFGEFTPNKVALWPFGTNNWQVRATSGVAGVKIRGFST